LCHFSAQQEAGKAEFDKRFPPGWFAHRRLFRPDGRYGTWLLRRGMHPRYDHLGSTRLGSGGLWEQMTHQGLSAEAITARVEKLAKG